MKDEQTLIDRIWCATPSEREREAATKAQCCYTECRMLHRTVLVTALNLPALPQAQGGVAAQKTPATPSSPSVLVLPLENSGGDPRLDAKNDAGDRP